MEQKEIVLSVKDLVIHFSTDHGYVQAVRGISFDLYKGETLCIVGESGSGKSVTSKSIMGILASNGRVKGGSIMYEGEDLTKVSEDEFHRIRGHKIGMIFQDPLSSLNPIVRIGKQITEAMLINNNRLKKIYDEKVAKELVDYKNALTERNSGIAASKDRIHFLKIDKNKVVDSYILHHSFADSEIYNLTKKAKEEIVEVAGKYNVLIDPLKEQLALAINEEEKVALKAEIKELEAQQRLEVKDIEIKLKAEILPLKAKKAEEKQENKKAVKQIKADYDRDIKEAKLSYKATKKALHEQFDEVIKEKKDIYKAKSKVAKEEVKKYAKELKDKYLADKKVLEQKLAEQKTEHAKLVVKNEINALKEKYISSIKITKKEAKERALKIMAEVGIPQPEKRFKQYPFEFSGGMRQRIVIAIALTADPDILICDEPTTALDVTIQAQILELINRLKKERNLSVIFVTHDLGVVANMADRVAVMYAGKIVEYGLADEIFYEPKHPYTWALLSSIPDVDSKERLEAIPGTPPNMIYPPVGDAFAIRSKYAMAIDFKKEPPLFKVSDTHYAATWLLDPRAPKVEMPVIVSTRIKNNLKNRKKVTKEAK